MTASGAKRAFEVLDELAAQRFAVARRATSEWREAVVQQVTKK
jgi:hypothetical protein